MSIYDRLSALGRGAAQGATGSLVDDIYPKILSNLPFDDKTGIPREYAGGSAEKQYRDEYRSDDADAASKYPTNFAAGQILGAAPAAIASSGLGAGGQVAAGTAMGALQGYGGSEKVGSSRLMDAVKGAAVGGGLASASNLATAAAPAVKTAWQNLTRPPTGGGLQPALAGASVPRSAPVPPVAEQIGGAQINQARSLPTHSPEFKAANPEIDFGQLDKNRQRLAALDKTRAEAQAAGDAQASVKARDEIKNLERSFEPGLEPLKVLPPKTKRLPMPKVEQPRLFTPEEMGPKIEDIPMPGSKGMLPPRGPNPGRYSVGDMSMPASSSPRMQADAAFGSAPTEMAPGRVARYSAPPMSAALEQAEDSARAALNKARFRPDSAPMKPIHSRLPNAEGAAEGRRFVQQETGEEFTAPYGKKTRPKETVKTAEPLGGTTRPGKARPKVQAR